MNPFFFRPAGRATFAVRDLRFVLWSLALGLTAIDPLAAASSGQLWFLAEGNATDARVAYVNNEGGSQGVNADNSPTLDLVTSFPAEIGLDTAAGFYFAIVGGGGGSGSNGRMVRGSIANGGPVTVVADFRRVIANTDDDIIVNALQVDPINKRIYTTWQDPAGTASNTGIRQYSYDPLTGAVTDLGFLVRADQDNTKPVSGSGFDLLDVRDFDLDLSTNTLYFTELLTGESVAEMGLYRMDLTTKAITQMVSSTQFPDNGSSGYIIDVEVDPSTDKVYFSAESNAPFGSTGYNASQNRIMVVAQNATNATATAVTLTGLPAGSHFYPGDMALDPNLRQLYVETDEVDNVGDDVIYVFQLDVAGTSASLIRTITPSPAFDASAANLQGMAFDALATLSALPATSNAVEQVPGNVLTADPTIADLDGDHLASATVAVSGGFSGSGDELFVLDGVTRRSSGLVTSTNITVTRVADGSGNHTLTLSGYDTIAHYQQVLGDVQFFANGDNPTNFGANGSRTITWQVNDGAVGNPTGTLNAASTNLRSSTLTITAVNDAPVNVKPGTQTLNEEGTLAIAGFSISGDADAPASASMTTTLSVTHGTLTVLPAGGASVSGSGTAQVILTGTRAQINTTLAAAGNVVYKSAADFFGADTLTMTTSDNGSTGPAAAQDVDTVGITVAGTNDNPVAGADTISRYPTQPVKVAVATLLANDSDIDGDTVAFVSAGPAAHGTVSVSGGMVFYTPTAGWLTGDSFTYSINDGHGGAATGTVTVAIASDNAQGQNIAKLELQPNGSMKVTFNGILGTSYHIQSCDNLAAGSWTNRATVTADSLGRFEFTDPGPLPPQRFYRCVTP